MSGEILNATLVAAPKRLSSRYKNAAIKRQPTSLGQNPAKASQKDAGPQWSRKYRHEVCGDKNHIRKDQRYKLARRYSVIGGAYHYSTELKGGAGSGQRIL